MLTEKQIEKLESISGFAQAVEAVCEAAEELEAGELGQGPGKSWRLTEKTAPVAPESAPVVFDYILSTDDRFVGWSKCTNKASGYKPLYNKGFWLATLAAADASGKAGSRRTTRFQVPSAAMDIYSDGDEADE